MARWRKSHEGPVPLGESLARVAAQISQRDLVGLAAIQRRWDEAVDPEILLHVSPLRLDGATLVVAVDEPTWATKVRLISGDLLTTLNGAPGVDVDGVVAVVRAP